jgi:perosamine synthetase
MIRHSSSELGPAEAEAALRCLRDNYVGRGAAAKALESTIAASVERKRALAVSSGFHALALALLALDLPRGSGVAVPVLTCASILSAIQHAKYEPVLCDIDPRFLTLDVSRIPPRCRAVVAPHAYGNPVDVTALTNLGIPWIEDCATSPASSVAGRPCGVFGTLAIFSFNSTKYLTGGGGGAVVADDDLLIKRMTELLDMDNRPKEPLWVHERPAKWPGWLGDLNASVALKQWERMKEFLERRREIASRYRERLVSLADEVVPLPDCEGGSCYRFCLKTKGPAERWAAALRKVHIDARSQVNPWLDKYLNTKQTFPMANLIRGNLLSLPIHLSMTMEDADRVVAAMEKVTRP